ncbi:sulfite exporter TauE/SafE family protein [Desulfovibrio sp.]|uniref:sulfite exporter TauE/SafE family protein n=1 Tax=Desulfovibrio sp. TaxID=885 RepID=UPI0023D78CA7|nr:sulfite exporter TauE/SafE family protein [Desulfovibrio sp.]MDE7241461.1 sulfite exporter TauE/SafE family protein [Desulfovibrio sp.]
MWAWLYFCITWLLAAVLSGLTSFGGNLFAVPLITLALPPREAILFGTLSGSAIFLGMAVVYARHVLWRETALLTAAALGGIPLGVWFLANAGARALLLAAGSALSLFLLWQFGSRFLRKGERAVPMWCAVPFGLLSGIMMSAVSFGGPPLVLYAFLRHWEKTETLGTVNAVSIGIMAFVIPWLWHKGLFTGELPLLGLAGSLAAFVGIAVSIPLARRLPTEIFRRLLLGMLVLSAIMLFWRGFAA